MDLKSITPLILTYNEAPNICRCLDRLRWADEIVVVDSCSSDETAELAGKFPQARVVQHPFETCARQWNFGLKETGIRTKWVLSLDADYMVTKPFLYEVEALAPPDDTSGYYTPFVYSVHGRRTRCGIYPPVAVLFRRDACEYMDDGHTQRLAIREGRAGFLKSPLVHDDRKPLSRWVLSQAKYMEREAEKLVGTPNRELGLADRLRKKIIFAPFVMFLYCLIAKRGILDGWAGLYYALQRMIAEAILSLKVIEKKLIRG